MSALRIYSNLEKEVFKSLRDISKYDAGTQARIRAALRSGTERVRDEAKARVPVRTGRLRQGIKYEMNVKGNQGIVRSTAPHSHLVEFGTGVSVVVPRRKKALKFLGRFSMINVIPARKARPFMRPAFEKEKPEIERSIREAVKPK